MTARVVPVIVAWGLASAAVTMFGIGSSQGSEVQGSAVQGSAVRGSAVPAQGESLRGAKVTFERVLPADQPKEVQSQRARLISLAVERGEVPSPFLQPGYFRATYEAVVTLPVRDRYRFRIDGRGSAVLSLNGEKVLDGSLRLGKVLETAEAVRMKKGDNDLRLEFESSAMGDGELRLFWAAPGAGFEPIAPEMLSWRAEDKDITAGELRRRGQHLFAERRCARCHEFEVRRTGESAFGELDALGPDLRSAGSRLQRDWIAAWLLDPVAFRHDATMPGLGLTEQEADDLAAWLAASGLPLAAEFAADAAAQGAERFLELGCIACHVAPQADVAGVELGDRLPLTHVAQKWHASGLVDYLQEPKRFYPHVRMPDFKLLRDDAKKLAAYLLAPASATQPAALRITKGDPERGHKIARRQRCAVCHALDVPFEEPALPKLRNLKKERGCLADKATARGDAPDHRLTEGDRGALRAFLPFAEQVPFRRAPLDYAQRHLTAQRCTACHGFDGQPSVWARLVDKMSMDGPLPPAQDPVAQGVPALTWVGAKLQPSWIAKFVTGDEKSPRPWLHARMPAFHQRGEAISMGLVREHGYGSQDEPAVAANAQMAIHGDRLVQMGTGFGCVQCHALGDKPPVQVFEREGIELFTAKKRLRHEYYSRWLLDPPRIDPDSRMPKYANDKGKTAFTGVLDGDAVQQFEAIWQFLGSRR